MGPDRQYVGSAACRNCHAAVYERWQKTRMANIVLDPKQHPDAIIPDLSKPDPLVTFTKDDIAFTYGSKWKQRYFKKVGDDYFALPAQWDVANKVWRAYKPAKGTDCWLPYYRQLQHPDQDAYRMERRLRKMSRTRRRARSPTFAHQHRQSGAARPAPRP